MCLSSIFSLAALPPLSLSPPIPSASPLSTVQALAASSSLTPSQPPCRATPWIYCTELATAPSHCPFLSLRTQSAPTLFFATAATTFQENALRGCVPTLSVAFWEADCGLVWCVWGTWSLEKARWTGEGWVRCTLWWWATFSQISSGGLVMSYNVQPKFICFYLEENTWIFFYVQNFRNTGIGIIEPKVNIILIRKKSWFVAPGL